MPLALSGLAVDLRDVSPAKILAVTLALVTGPGGTSGPNRLLSGVPGVSTDCDLAPYSLGRAPLGFFAIEVTPIHTPDETSKATATVVTFRQFITFCHDGGKCGETEQCGKRESPVISCCRRLQITQGKERNR